MTTNMEDHLKEVLQCQYVRKFGPNLGGCISEASGYDTDLGKVYVKSNSKEKAGVMFNGEFYGLKEIAQTKTVNVPEPLLTGALGPKYYIVMRYSNIKSLNKFSAQLGRDLARLHLHNIEKLKSCNNRVGENDSAVERFGFHVATSCGYLQQNNDWLNDWVSFYTRKRLVPQIEMIQRDTNCREIGKLWSELQLKIPTFFVGINVKPSLLHGDLWSGNAGETNDHAIVFDPAAFYGHHEYDLAIAGMFGGFSREFYNSYYGLLPKQEGFHKRHQLYQLFHHLNHWNHFGSGYKEPSFSLMRDLLR